MSATGKCATVDELLPGNIAQKDLITGVHLIVLEQTKKILSATFTLAQNLPSFERALAKGLPPRVLKVHQKSGTAG